MPFLLLGLAAVLLVVASRSKGTSPRMLPAPSLFVPLSAVTEPGNQFNAEYSPVSYGLPAATTTSKGQTILVPFGVLTSAPPFADHVMLIELMVTENLSPSSWNARVEAIRKRPPGVEGAPARGAIVKIEPYNLVNSVVV